MNTICPLQKTDQPLNLMSIFESIDSLSYSAWIKKLSILLFDLFDDKYLQAVAARQTSFAEAVLPLLVKITLSLGNGDYNNQLAAMIKTFFQNHYQLIHDEVCHSIFYLSYWSIINSILLFFLEWF